VPVVGLVLAGVLAAVAGCARPNAPGPVAGPDLPFQACPAAATASASVPASASVRMAGSVPAVTAFGGTAVSGPLPTLALACLAGGAPVDLSRLGRPAVINIWASSCAPCRRELPQLQRFAELAGGRVLVIGVDTGDTVEAASAAARDFGVSFPSVFDPDQAFLRGVGRSAIPVTLFVDAAGQMRGIDVSGALTLDTLRDLTVRHLGVEVR
jgi:thiol-disulfide isomerase/thioredoxin